MNRSDSTGHPPASGDSAVPAVPGPVALVTGSGSARVGNCVARHLAEHGYRVAIHANRSREPAERTVAELQAAGVEAAAFFADMQQSNEVVGLVTEVHRHFGQLDALVNCAAIWQPKPLEEVTADDVRRHFEINTLGTFLCCQQAGLIMASQSSGGAIVNFGDWATTRPYANYAAYFPSKGAVEALTRSLAVELAARNPRVRVNAVLPGPAMLPADLPEAERREAIAGTLLGRSGSPDNLAEAVLFLLRNDFITGVCLPVDGGRTIAG